MVIDPANPPPHPLDGVRGLVLTHGHFDHYMHVYDWISMGVSGVLMHSEDVPLMEGAKEWVERYFGVPVPEAPPVEGYLREGDVLEVGGLHLRVWEVPGHSPGSIALVSEGVVFVGDLIFEGGAVGRTDLPGGDPALLLKSLRRVLTLPEDTTVYPGHGNPFTVKDARTWLSHMLSGP